MSQTRQQILQRLKERGRMTVAQLAEELGLTPVTVHYHLNVLQRQGLVDAQLERRGVGRPRLVFFLREEALSQFPQGYHRLAARLLNELKTRMPEEEIHRLFIAIAREIAVEHGERVRACRTLEEKLEALVTLLGEEGFLARWEQLGNELRLHQYNCPYNYVVHHHPEVCDLDRALISLTLEADVERARCILSGDIHCTFIIKPQTAQPFLELSSGTGG
ncbi:helix-turn-helix transcriptional regulator [Thermoflexus sp.]|uniref:helix-turn-helix transcriptional regulator n=1 Tax=Thermoflexus sp. TaxID=1969742 RepID=UPI0025DAB1E8|nr:helix-turn-helix domain-containing protein [Thermoflexus sp.]MDW8181139.1 ArsR family transcriptional regulator [Anaerolineae bacterium]MCS6964875.1 ArsR family transcriptional regulator [Thermoflexus sp.]MCS7351681.1 ArsR family transcriptional regulator [Thermoflexus sp.]MCX7691347.1 ArsR family transcriptional regulator [Thermoflexus sp.]MDW8184365.1 ArsR family transcriptional regulator [Anaerolineae bacterium]